MVFNTTSIKEKYHQYVMGTYSPELVLVKGQGCYVWDSEGRQYLDFAAGIAVCNLGHCHPNVTRAITEQVGKLVHVSNLYINEHLPILAEKLIKHCFDGVCFFCNSGAEANEGMIKLARQWGSESGRYEIIAMDNSFHGRTLATLAATGRKKYRNGFSPDMPGFKHVPFNDLKAIESSITEKTVAIILEPIQGEGGIIPADFEYLQGVRKLCDQHNLLLMFDEVQCGMGRSGTFFAWQGYGIEPDVVSMAKALGNGYPMGCFIAKRQYQNVLKPGMHASTFGGTPLAAAAACAVIDTIDQENILENVNIQGKKLCEKLEQLKTKCPCIQGVRGKGLIIGLLLDFPAASILPLLREKGLIALPAGETVLRLVPPLTLGDVEVDKAIEIIESVLVNH